MTEKNKIRGRTYIVVNDEHCPFERVCDLVLVIKMSVQYQVTVKLAAGVYSVRTRKGPDQIVRDKGEYRNMTGTVWVGCL